MDTETKNKIAICDKLQESTDLDNYCAPKIQVCEKTKAKFISLDTKFGEKLYKSVERDHGIKWLVGGWCAE